MTLSISKTKLLSAMLAFSFVSFKLRFLCAYFFYTLLKLISQVSKVSKERRSDPSTMKDIEHNTWRLPGAMYHVFH